MLTSEVSKEIELVESALAASKPPQIIEEEMIAPVEAPDVESKPIEEDLIVFEEVDSAQSSPLKAPIFKTKPNDIKANVGEDIKITCSVKEISDDQTSEDS